MGDFSEWYYTATDGESGLNESERIVYEDFTNITSVSTAVRLDTEDQLRGWHAVWG